MNNEKIGILFSTHSKYEIKKIRGKVSSGLGKGGFFLSRDPYKSFFRGLLGKNPYPGTLNVELDIDWREVLPLKNYFQPVNMGGLWYSLGEIKDLLIVIIRPKKSGHPNNIVEIVASEYLRGYLNLKDGDEICFTVFL